MADLDFGKIKLYVGNYDFWKESSELAAKLQADRNAKSRRKIKQLQNSSLDSLPMLLSQDKRLHVKKA